jgi:hypothetical protein
MKRDAVPSLFLALVVVAAATTEVRGDPSGMTYLTTLPRIGVVEQNGWWSDRGELVLGGSSGARPIRKPLALDGRRSEHGVYLHARPHGESSVTYRLGKRFGTLRSDVLVPEMLPEQGPPRTPLIFEVRGDGRTLWKSKPLGRKGERQSCSVSVEGVEELSLVVICRGPENWGLAAWFEPRLMGGRLDRRTPDEVGSAGVVAGSKVEAEVGRQSTVIPEGRFGFRFFPDQPVSVLGTKPLTFLMVVPPDTILMRGDSFEDARPVRSVLRRSGTPGAYDQKDAAINSVHIDRERKEILAFFHAERPTGGLGFSGTVRFYATVGLAVSGDRNLDFRKVGPILSGVPEDPGTSETAQGVGEPSVCVDHTGEWLYLYYTDHSRIDPRTGKERSVITCMARCKVSDGGRPGKWSKYYDGSFGEPGLGGKDSEVANCWGASVTYIAEMRKYVMVGNRDGICYFTSDDGIHWAKGGTLVEAHDVPVIGEPVAFHPRLLVNEATPEGATGQLVYSYSPRFSRPRMQVPGQTHFFVKRPIRLRIGD